MEDKAVLTENDVSIKLKKMYDDSEDRITANAIVSRAFTDRISVDSITQKVDSQLNAITAGIQGINPKFKEGSKNYDVIKNRIVETMSNYESALIELSKFYDTKIEQLILRRVELESSLVGIIINDEYLYQIEKQRLSEKENNSLKSKIAEGIQKVTQKIKGKKEQNQIDLRLINTMQDSKELEDEMDKRIQRKIENTKVESKDNKQLLDKVEKEIHLTDDEIKRLNKLKKEALLNAMEEGDKWLDVSIKRPRMFKKITRFFISKFNTPKIVNQTIIDPLNQRIENFVSNELVNMKGE